jgi:hypothetical protein
MNEPIVLPSVILNIRPYDLYLLFVGNLLSVRGYHLDKVSIVVFDQASIKYKHPEFMFEFEKVSLF